VEQERHLNAERQQRFRERRRDPETDDFLSDRHRATNGVSHAAGNALRNGVRNTAPTRPDPSLPDLDFRDVAQESALGVAVSSEKKEAVDALLAEIKDRDEDTDSYVWRFAEKLPPAAFHSAREAL